MHLEMATSKGLAGCPQGVTRQAGALKRATPAFRRWFGFSKVVDAAGNPLVVYHGTTNAGFSTFKVPELGFFSSDKNVAASYGADKPVELRDRPALSTVAEVRAFIEDHQMAFEGCRLRLLERKQIFDDEGDMPRIYWEFELYWEGLAGYCSIGEYRPQLHREDLARLWEDAVAALAQGPTRSGVYSVHLRIENPMIVDAAGAPWMAVRYGARDLKIAEIAAIALREGYDGLIVRNTYDSNVILDKPSDVYVVFRSEQIKLASNDA